MDTSFNLAMGGIFLVIALIFAGVAFAVFSKFKKLGKLLNRAHLMTAKAEGTISELVTVRRRNRTFRWTNQYPIVSYQVNGKSYTTALTFAEARKGKYRLGGNYTVYYIPNEPDCCIVDEFRSKMQSSRTMNLVGVVILAILTCNMLFGALTTMLGLA